MFQSVYDYPYLSSSANHIFDISFGYDESSTLSSSANPKQRSKKINNYNQLSQVLLGYTGSNNTVRRFESDLTLDGAGEMKDVFAINLSRLVTKDEVKKGSVLSLVLLLALRRLLTPLLPVTGRQLQPLPVCMVF